MQKANFEVLKEPRGFIRCLELLFAIVAFATLANFSTKIGINIVCKNSTDITNVDDTFHQFDRTVSYPFKVKSLEPIDVEKENVCKIRTVKEEDKTIHFLGDFSSDAQFFVFTGVISFLYSIFSLVLYVYYGALYMDSMKRNPKIDFMISALLAMFWLAGAAAWANGLTGLKWASDTSNWLYKMPCASGPPTPPLHTPMFRYETVSDQPDSLLEPTVLSSWASSTSSSGQPTCGTCTRRPLGSVAT